MLKTKKTTSYKYYESEVQNVCFTRAAKDTRAGDIQPRKSKINNEKEKHKQTKISTSNTT